MAINDHQTRENWFNRYAERWFGYVDNIILVAVTIGIIALAVIMLIEAFSDFYYFSEHSISHILSDLMFVLILMELMRQVVRQLSCHAFSLNPFFFIGVIASIRGILITLMKLAMGEAEGWFTLAQIGVYTLVALVMVISYYISSKTEGSAAN